MPPSYFPLRWESTGDKWWYASPIDWAAANGLYDLVRELLRLDGNHLIKLTSLRRIRRLEAVWDDETQLHDVVKCRCQVAQKLFLECESKKGKNSLIRAGYGGWLLYTAASAGDFDFVKDLLGRDPLLVFGEGEYGLTDILYAAARSKNLEVFKVIYGYAVTPRFGKGDMEGGANGGIPVAFTSEVKNRAVHAAARGGNLDVLKYLIGDSDDVLRFTDAHGSTVLHAAAGRGQVEVVKHLIASYDIISSLDNEGNTALHVAAYRGRLSVVEALLNASPSSSLLTNKAGNTFLHMAVAGFETPGFRRIDHQVELMKKLVNGKALEDIINTKNAEGRTALHTAIIGDVPSELVELLMTARFINVNIRDDHGMTPLDYLKRQPLSASSEILIRQLISVGGMSSCQDYTARKAFASHLRKQSFCNSPGASFRVSDTELFLSTGIERGSDVIPHRVSIRHISSSSEVSQCESVTGEQAQQAATNVTNLDVKKMNPVQNAAKRLKTMFRWSKMKIKKPHQPKKMPNEDLTETNKKLNSCEQTPIPLRQKFTANTPSPSSNKRTLAVRSNISSPTNRKRFAAGLGHDGMQDLPHVNIPARSPSSSFSKSSLSSCNSVDKGKGILNGDDVTVAGPSCLNQMHVGDDDDTPNLVRKQGSLNKMLMNQYLCFGATGLGTRLSVSKQPEHHRSKSIPSF